MTTKYQLAELSQRRLNKGNQGPNEDIDIQELILAVHQAFGVVVKNSWFQGKNEGISELGGEFIYSFKNVPVQFDNDLQLYYATLPSSYIDLPHEMGVQYVNSMQTGNPSQPQSKPFVRVFNNFPALSQGLAVENLQGRFPFYVEGINLYFPKMNSTIAGYNLLIKLAVSLEGVDEDTPLNISPEIQAAIIDMVVQKYIPEKSLPENKIGDKL